MSNNKLWLHSPIAFNKELADKINELGEVAYIVAPNKHHYGYLFDWCNHYPNVKIWLAKGVRDKLKAKGKLNENFISLNAISKTVWSEEILFTPFKGSITMEEMVFFHRKSSTVIFTDLIQNIEVKKLSLKLRILLKIGDNQYPKARTPRDLRLSFIFKRQAIESYNKICSWNADKIIFAHGKIILENGNENLKKAFFWLDKK
ncbi:DUF4336 domain-containing protein [Streptococcus zalophi]|uniref:DUF4336 domain-containing protein n=1 Tax=Streptococcus zalophi TaxID=640031 RepID=UPI00215BD5EB|nr:DUF4336 domain-containing protein [Streptococcus zalophi]MCR8967854.1 DUF4336 domain-containing protein [Streptococcus zalophi]